MDDQTAVLTFLRPASKDQTFFSKKEGLDGLLFLAQKWHKSGTSGTKVAQNFCFLLLSFDFFGMPRNVEFMRFLAIFRHFCGFAKKAFVFRFT